MAEMLGDMFPHIPFDRLISTVQKSKGDLDVALQLLLNEDVDKAPNTSSNPLSQTQTLLIDFTDMNETPTKAAIPLMNQVPLAPQSSPIALGLQKQSDLKSEVGEGSGIDQNTILQLCEVFPGISFDHIADVLTSHSGDVDQSINALLQEKVQEGREIQLKLSGGLPIGAEVFSLRKLCLSKIALRWDLFSSKIDGMEDGPLKNQIMFFMSENGLLPDVQSDDETEYIEENAEFIGDMNALNDEFSKIFDDEDEHHYVPMNSDQLRMDEEFARMLEAMDRESTTRLKQKEEEDRLLAVELARAESYQFSSQEDRKLAESLLKQEESERKQKLETDEELARKLAESDRAAELARAKRIAEEDARLARSLYEKEARLDDVENDALLAQTLMKAEQEEENERRRRREMEIEDEKIAKLLREKEEQEIENERLAREFQKKLEEEGEDMMELDQKMEVKPNEGALVVLKPEDRFTHDSNKYVAAFSKEISRLNLKQITGAHEFLIEKVVKPELSAKFEKQWMAMKAKYKDDRRLYEPVLAFHGTAAGNVPNIVRAGLLVPGEKGHKHATDSGWWGKGIYLSPNPSISVGYCRDGGKLLVCAVLMGKRFNCKNRMDGQPKVGGYDSHVSPDGNEFVLFSASQVLPLFVIKFDRQVNVVMPLPKKKSWWKK
eukprot:TRINITY_DN5591_c0_g1_i1.p1 TRINITY_DN5591_c0_g1~~TRINITY_DN5591_c0_g1_i1.p1  ORF type:complete len:684 (+),score=208.72 TRINITY_DN5591_c0_g1_i1:62-2053(+)